MEYISMDKLDTNALNTGDVIVLKTIESDITLVFEIRSENCSAFRAFFSSTGRNEFMFLKDTIISPNVRLTYYPSCFKDDSQLIQTLPVDKLYYYPIRQISSVKVGIALNSFGNIIFPEKLRDNTESK